MASTSRNVERNLCRLCLTSSPKSLDSLFNRKFFKSNQSNAVALETYTKLKCKENDGLPAHICRPCLLLIRKFHTAHLKWIEVDGMCRSVLNATTNTMDRDTGEEIDAISKTFEKVDVPPGKPNTNEENVDVANIADFDDWDIISEIADEPKSAIVENLSTNAEMKEIDSVQNEQESGQADSKEYVANKSGKRRWSLSSHESDGSIEVMTTCGPLRRKYCRHLDVVNSNKPKNAHGFGDRNQNKGFNRPSLNRDLSPYLAEQQYQCPICVFKCDTNFDLVIHKQSHQIFEFVMCPLCDIEFMDMHKLRNHMQLHMTGYRCSFCRRPFETYLELGGHVCFREKRLEYTCDSCDKTFLAMRFLAEHELTHNGPTKIE